MELNKIYNGDCLELMKNIPDGSIDMVLCDLPYGTTQNKWDCVIDLELMWMQYKRITKYNSAIVLTAQTPFDKVLGASNLSMLKYEWIWHKDRATGHLNSKKMPMKSHENILVFYKNLPTYNPQKTTGHKPANTSSVKRNKEQTNYGKFDAITSGGYTDRFHRSVIDVNVVNSSDRSLFHPTQKPVQLFEYLIKTYTNDGDTVLDNCSGSGTTAIASLNTCRKYICIEKDKVYYNNSLERIKQHTQQTSLFQSA